MEHETVPFCRAPTCDQHTDRHTERSSNQIFRDIYDMDYGRFTTLFRLDW